MKKTPTPGVRATRFVATWIMVAGLTSTAQAQVNVFVDFSNFEIRLDEATTAAGVADFNAVEIGMIRSNIMSSLNTAFAGYLISFSETSPGGIFETLNFGLTGGGFGVADRIDFLNQVNNDTARVFTANFSTFLEAGDSRAQQILELSTSLSGTAAHEVGHNLGLEHRDPYGIAGLGMADSNGGYFTGGQHNTHIMATGITGLNEAERETPRSFSDLSHVKLEFASNLTASPLTTTAEQAGDHSTAATAQQVNFQDLTMGNSAYDRAAVVEASLTAGEDDFYSFDLLAGEFATIQIISQVLFADDIDAVLSLFDIDGSTLLVSNDDTFLDGNGVNQGGSSYSLDSSIYNFLAPSSGQYFLQVSPFSGGDTGFYDLLFAATSLNPIPEPGSGLLLIVLSVAGWTARRRRIPGATLSGR